MPPRASRHAGSAGRKRRRASRRVEGLRYSVAPPRYRAPDFAWTRCERGISAPHAGTSIALGRDRRAWHLHRLRSPRRAYEPRNRPCPGEHGVAASRAFGRPHGDGHGGDRPGPDRQPALPPGQAAAATRRATTGTWRSPTRCATACSIAISGRWRRLPHSESAVKVVAYFSAEFLTGPHLGNNLIALGIWGAAQQAVSRVGQDLRDLLDQEEEPGLGNGGLGRLAACYMDSLATLNVPAIGYGIRYEFGIFDQAIRDGWQVELTDKWLRFGNPWEIVRPEVTYRREVRRTHRILRRRAGPLSRPLDSREGGQGRRLRHADPGLRRNDHQPAAALEGGSRRVVRFRRVQRRRLLPRGGSEGRLRNHLEGAVSERRARSRQAAAAGAAVSSSCPARCRTCSASRRSGRSRWTSSTRPGPRS